MVLYKILCGCQQWFDEDLHIIIMDNVVHGTLQNYNHTGQYFEQHTGFGLCDLSVKSHFTFDLIVFMHQDLEKMS